MSPTTNPYYYWWNKPSGWVVLGCGGVGDKGKALGDNMCIRTSGIRFTVICCYKDEKKLFKIDRYNVWTEIFKTLPLNFQLASDFDVNSNYWIKRILKGDFLKQQCPTNKSMSDIHLYRQCSLICYIYSLCSLIYTLLARVQT